MIAKLTGFVDSTDLDSLIVDVHGVGYLVYASARTLNKLPPLGNRVTLRIEEVLRNEQTHLFGFFDTEEQDWFRLLTTVQGVGAKVALAILSALSPEELTAALATQDKTAITRAEGVGPKLASRIIAELKDKVPTLAIAVPTTTTQLSSLHSGMSEATSALVNLGYRRSEAVEAVAKSIHQEGPEVSTETLIRQALSFLSQSVLGTISHG
jgi:Holliday junction DNA helicase RuvA